MVKLRSIFNTQDNKPCYLPEVTGVQKESHHTVHRVRACLSGKLTIAGLGATIKDAFCPSPRNSHEDFNSDKITIL